MVNVGSKGLKLAPYGLSRLQRLLGTLQIGIKAGYTT